MQESICSDPAVAKLVAERDYFSVSAHGKVHCKLTGHDLVPDLKIVETHLAGSHFKKHLEW
jgi:hypothetical protein